MAAEQLRQREARGLLRLQNKFRQDLAEQRRHEQFERKLKDKENEKARLLEEKRRDQQALIEERRYAASLDAITKEGKRQALQDMRMQGKAGDPTKAAAVAENRMLAEEMRLKALEKRRLADKAKEQ